MSSCISNASENLKTVKFCYHVVTLLIILVKKNILEVSTLKGIKKNANDVDDKLVAANLLRKTQELVCPLKTKALAINRSGSA